MKTKFISAFAAIAVALAITSPLSFAKVYSPSQFNTELKKKIGTKTGASAASAAANFYKQALGDKKNKKNAEKYAKSIVKALKKPVVPALQGNATNTLVKALLDGYFKGVKFNLNDAVYNKAIVALLKGMPASEKVKPTVSQAIYYTVKSFSLKKGATVDQAYNFMKSVDSKSGVVAPPLS